MSVNLFYPENEELARRSIELMDDVVNMQTSVNGKFDDNTVVSNDLHNLVNDIMAAHGYKTYDDIKDAMLKQLPEDKRKEIEDMLNKQANIMKGLDITFQVCMLITATAGVVGLGTKAFMFVQSGALTNAFAKRINYITDIFKGSARAMSAEEKAAETLLVETVEVAGDVGKEASTVGTKIVRFCKIIGYIGVALDVFLIGLAAWEGHKQKEQLIDNIHYLNTRRVICRIYQREAEALVNFSGQLKAVLQLMKLPSSAGINEAISALEQGFLDDVQKVNGTYGVLQAYDDLSKQDAARNSHVSDDLSLADIKTQVDKDPDAPVLGPQHPPTTTVTTMAVSSNTGKKLVPGALKLDQDSFEKHFKVQAAMVH